MTATRPPGTRLSVPHPGAAITATPGCARWGLPRRTPSLPSGCTPRPGARWMTIYLKGLTMELAALGRACGKSDVHNLEPVDLAALTVEAAAMAQVPLAGPNWIPGHAGR
jgi:hypothetical protein